MPDREKVIKALENCAEGEDRDCNRCIYSGEFACQLEIIRDALALLQEQEDMGKELTDAMELIHKKNERIEKLLKEQDAVKIEVKKINNSGRCGRCPNCLMELNEMDYPNYCGYCGQKVKWE